MQEHQELRRSLLELSMQTLSKGQLLLDRLREASSHADINNRHATKAACFSIERTLETLSHRRRKLDELWKTRRKALEQCVRKCRVQDETSKVNYSWVSFNWPSLALALCFFLGTKTRLGDWNVVILTWRYTVRAPFTAKFSNHTVVFLFSNLLIIHDKHTKEISTETKV